MKSWKLRLNAGEHERMDCPVSAVIPAVGAMPAGLRLVEAQGGRVVPCQGGLDGQGNLHVHWILDYLAPGHSREYVLEEVHQPAAEAVLLVDKGDKVEISIGGELFSAYHYAPSWARPFLWPVIGPYGDSVTRNYPMDPSVPGEKHDHPHHKSIYTAFGDVNGVDDWSEMEGHGRIVHRRFRQLRGGPVLGVIQAENDWVSKDGQKVLSEVRTIVIYNLLPSRERIVDFTIHFQADQGPVRFGDTKEGGILAVRVATSMDVTSGLGGRIENSFGGINERETWGKKAHWCDYSGPVQGRLVGITIMDNPENLRHPTEYHVRNYGLMTANPFAWHDYKGDPTLDGSYTVPAGGSLTFRYRLLIHKGDARGGRVASRYHDYINPPAVEIL
jgi:hypothetical protein